MRFKKNRGGRIDKLMHVETQFNINMKNKIPIVEIDGDLDHYNLARFNNLLRKLINEGNAKLILDMSKVDFMDSGGMSGLVFAMKRLAAIGGLLFLANCNPRIMRKLEISGFTKLSQMICVCGSVDKAIQEAQAFNPSK